jgi:hypothetical protein
MRLLSAIGLLLIGCGSGDESGGGQADGCTHPAVGTWVGVAQNDRITLFADAKFEYSGPDGCLSNGTFACPAAGFTQGTMQVSINSSTGGACLPAGTYTCAFGINGNAMDYDCTGNGAIQYRRP